MPIDLINRAKSSLEMLNETKLVSRPIKLYKSFGVPVTGIVHRILLEANAARERGEWVAAAKAYRTALARDPELVHIWIQLGHAFKELGEVDEADQAYSEASRLSPGQGEPYLHRGHLRKDQGNITAANRFYVEAGRRSPDNNDILFELRRIASSSWTEDTDSAIALLIAPGADDVALNHQIDFQTAAAAARRSVEHLLRELQLNVSDISAESAAKLGTARALLADICNEMEAGSTHALEQALVFDVSDLMAYFRDSRLPTGIQRVQIEVISNALVAKSIIPIRICSFVEAREEWLEIPPREFLHIAQLSLKSGDGGAADWVGPLTRLELSWKTAAPFAFPSDTTLINLGTSWWISNYFLRLRLAKRATRGVFHYVPFVHDLIPLVAPQHCAKGLTRDFIGWLTGVFSHAERFLVNSEATKSDLLSAARTLGLSIGTDRITVVPLDADFRKSATAQTHATSTELNRVKAPYVLFVSTIESRKNHLLAFDAWLELVRLKGINHVPQLVCVGKDGWLNDAIYDKLSQSAELREKVLHLSGVSDAALVQLYQQALFTLYPSSFEGWGLPVTESLCYGKVPLVANASSLPEAGGEFAVYFQAESRSDLIKSLLTLIYSAGVLEKLERKIEQNYKPRSWRDVSAQIVSVAEDWATQKPSFHAEMPLAMLGAYHSLAKRSDERIWRGMRSADLFRADAGWWGQDDFGCWTKPEGAVLEFSLPRAHGPLRLYVQLHGLPSCQSGYRVTVSKGARPHFGRARDNQLHWALVDVPGCDGACEGHSVCIRGDQAEDLQVQTKGGDKRVISIGCCGIFVCESADVKTRITFMEACTFANLSDLAFDREPVDGSDIVADGAWPALTVAPEPESALI
jgi:glycosyltransferase involved in cell wall biosynthesis